MAHATRLDLQRFLDRLTSRSVLTEEEQQAILNLPGHTEQVRANSDFVRHGERVDHSCLIIAGIVGRFEQTREGMRQITAMHIAGDMCDLQSVVQPIPTSALQALSVSTILRVPHGAVRTIAGRYPAVAEALWRDCMVDAAITNEWVVNVGRRDAKTRVAHLLCEMAARLAGAKHVDNVILDFPVTQNHMADATGLTPVHINRTLQSLRADGLIEWRGGVLRLPDWDALIACGEFDPTYLQVGIEPEQRMRIVQAS